MLILRYMRPLDITVLSELPVISTRIDLAMVKVQIIASTHHTPYMVMAANIPFLILEFL